MKNSEQPWTSGPREILAHGFDLIREDTDSSRRLAMILIDNAIELTIKTFLGLPKRVTGLAIPSSKYQEFSENFPKLLDGLETYAPEKLVGLNLGDIEWYHRLRNQLYHQGNGLTVEQDKLTVYAQIASTLYTNLFGSPPDLKDPTSSDPLSHFLSTWARIESSLLTLASQQRLSIFVEGRASNVGTTSLIKALAQSGAIPAEMASDLLILRDIRNRIVHARLGKQESLTPSNLRRTRQIAKQLDAIVKPS